MTNMVPDGPQTTKIAECDLVKLRIKLLADDVEDATQHMRTAWHPGDLLEGFLQIWSVVRPTSMRLRVFFEGMLNSYSTREKQSLMLTEGVTRTWAVLDRSDALNGKTMGMAHKVRTTVKQMYCICL